MSQAEMEPTLRALMERARRDLKDHPTPEVLVAYHAGELPPEEEESLRDHLALCHECADEYLELVGFAETELPAKAAPLGVSTQAASWQKLQARIRAEEAPDAPADDPAPAAPVAAPAPVVPLVRPAPAEAPRLRSGGDGGYDEIRWQRKVRVAYALAAALFLGVVGLSVWGFSLRKQVWQGREPVANVPTANAYSEADRSRGTEPEEAVQPTQDVLILFLHSSQEISLETEYEAVLRPVRGGDLLFRVRGLSLLKDGYFSMRLPGDSFPPGEYAVDLYPKGKTEKVDTLIFRVASPPS